MILTPAHGTLPSGHATEAFTSALVLWRLLRDAAAGGGITLPYADQIWGLEFMRLAARIAINRTVAGVHFPVDSAAGAVLGLTLGQYFVARCSQASGTASNYDAWKFDGPNFPKTPAVDADFQWFTLYDVDATPPAQKPAPPYATLSSAGVTLAALGQSAILHWLWNEAMSEWT